MFFHHVTVVGIKGEKIIIHDSAIRSGLKLKNEHCYFKKINSGTLSGWQNYKERSASEYSILEGIKVKEGADFGIVDGAAVFKIF